MYCAVVANYLRLAIIDIDKKNWNVVFLGRLVTQAEKLEY